MGVNFCFYHLILLSPLHITLAPENFGRWAREFRPFFGRFGECARTTPIPSTVHITTPGEEDSDTQSSVVANDFPPNWNHDIESPAAYGLFMLLFQANADPDVYGPG